MKRTWTTKLNAATGGSLATGALFVILVTAMTLPSPASAVSMTDYTWMPVFVGQNVPPNILFIVDFSNFTLQDAFSGTGHQYPISACLNCPTHPAGTPFATVTSSQYAANVTISSENLVAVDQIGAAIAGASTAAPADIFDPTHSYFGLFDPFRCYTTNSNSFIYAATKINLTDSCAVVNGWDGNFLNWLAMRKMDIIYQALVGGAPKPAQANADGSANSLAGQSKTGENASPSKNCGGSANPPDNSKTCWRYVKFVPTLTLTGRVPTTILPAVGTAGAAQVPSGQFFGSGESTLYVNNDATANPFDGSHNNTVDSFNLQVDLTTEPNVPSGNSSTSGTCDELDPNFAGHLICYKRDRSLGLFQKLRTDAMRTAIMFVDAGGGNAGNMQFLFDAAFNSSSVTNIRNQAVQTHSPLAEALYEALCYYRKSQGTCYANAPASYDSSVQTPGDAFWFANYPTPQTVSCCKSFVLMISPGVPDGDGNTPQRQTPFPNAAAPSVCMLGIGGCGADTLGVTTSWLDNIAYYGQTHDVRDQACPSASCVTGTQTVAIYQAYFFPSQFEGLNEIKWTGFAQGLFVDSFGNIREDYSQPGCTGPPDGKLVLEHDCIIKTRFDSTTNEVKVDRFKDDGTATGSVAGDGVADTSTPFETVSLKDIKPIWEAGARLAYLTPGTASCTLPNAGISCRRILTWTDNNFDKAVASSEVIELIDANKATLCPYFGARRVGDCNSSVAADKTNALLEASNVINFTRGLDGKTLCISGAECLRDRSITVRNPDDVTSSALQVWKLGDIVDSTPTVVGSPKERFDVIYGDTTYSTFITQYKNRRQVAYVGANDGMLHAFNAGFFVQGDDGSMTPKVVHGKFTTAPPSGITTTRSTGECAPGNSSGCLPRGAELWAFVPP